MTDKPKTTIRYLYPQGFEPLDQRSVGDVPAPDLCARAHGTPDHMIEATLATSVERARCANLLRELLQLVERDRVDRYDVGDVLRRIEKP